MWTQISIPEIVANLNSMPIGYTRVINGKVVTRWSNGFEFETVTARPERIKSRDDAAMVLLIAARQDACHGERLR
jgi:hypothetical protein